jgi:porin-like protein
MRNMLFLIFIAILPVSSALAETKIIPKPPKHPTEYLPLKGAHAGNSCTAYGPGFVKIEGTETCMKVGGATGIGAGVSSGSR